MGKWNFTQHNPFKAVYDTNRRSVYLMTQRFQRHPFFALFDGADTNASTDRRMTSTTPLQALYLMNDPVRPRAGQEVRGPLLAEGEGRRGPHRPGVPAALRPPADDRGDVPPRRNTWRRWPRSWAGSSKQQPRGRAWPGRCS